MKKVKRKIINSVVYSLLAIIFILFVYIRYLFLVDEGKADSIEILKVMVIENIVEKYDSIQKKDSIIIELEIEIDSLQDK